MTEFLGIVMVIAAISVVGWPLVSKAEYAEGTLAAEDTELANLLLQKESTFSTLSEMEEDHIMGNLSAADYGELRQKYEQKAISVMREIDNLQREQAEQIEEEIKELRLGRHATGGATRTCPSCTAELDPDDNFCPKCGKVSGHSCPGCSAPIGLVDADHRFCPRCV